MANPGPGALAMPEEQVILRREILALLPDAERWLMTPHPYLDGDTPASRIARNDLEPVRDLLYSILYVGVT